MEQFKTEYKKFFIFLIVEILCICLCVAVVFTGVYFYLRQFKQVEMETFQFKDEDNLITIQNYQAFLVEKKDFSKIITQKGNIAIKQDSIQNKSLLNTSLQIGECFSKDAILGENIQGEKVLSDCVGCVLNIEQSEAGLNMYIVNYNLVDFVVSFPKSVHNHIDYNKNYLCKIACSSFDLELISAEYDYRAGGGNVECHFHIIDISLNESVYLYDQEDFEIVLEENNYADMMVIDKNILNSATFVEGRNYSVIIRKEDNSFEIATIYIEVIGDEYIGINSTDDICGKSVCVEQKT